MPEFPKAADSRMKIAPFLRTAGPAVLVLICAAASPVSWANAQTFGRTYTSTAPKDCRVKGVDDSTELARRAADEFARDFNCGKDEVKVIGEKGAAVSLAKR